MAKIPFERLYGTEFYISEPLAKPQYWAARGNEYNAMGKPKISHTLLWFKNCNGSIISKEGKTLTVLKNQLCFMSKGTEYVVKFENTGGAAEDTVVVHFQMTDKAKEDIIPCDFPIIAIKHVDTVLAHILDGLAEEFKKNVVCFPDACADVYKLLSAVCKRFKRKSVQKKYSYILSGIELLEEDTDLSIKQIAKECGVSESYFRRMFSEYSGESPMAFKQRHRIEKAKQLLLMEENFSISEISLMLGFSDIYHFSKTFKKYCGVSPSAYLKNESEK